MATDAEIIALADGSPLISFDWPHRGVAPKAYIRGMAVAFARFLEVLHADDNGSAMKKAVARATADAIGDKTADVLAWYAPELAAVGASTATADDKLVALFSIMLGLGMRESSGQHCVGADTPEDRGEPTTEANAEAGLFQVSFDSIGSDPLRQALFDAFVNRTDLLDVFSAHVTCKPADLHNFGTGTGAKFQEAMKKCPLFAALYTAQFLRGHRKHWGPINRKQAEARADAVKLLNSVRAKVLTPPGPMV
jgi:hypothetical protein